MLETQKNLKEEIKQLKKDLYNRILIFNQKTGLNMDEVIMQANYTLPAVNLGVENLGEKIVKSYEIGLRIDL
jgi:hypothetical protein